MVANGNNVGSYTRDSYVYIFDADEQRFVKIQNISNGGEVYVIMIIQNVSIIDDVTYDVMPGSMRTRHRNIHCSFAWQLAHISCLVRACAFKTPATLHKSL